MQVESGPVQPEVSEQTKLHNIMHVHTYTHVKHQKEQDKEREKERGKMKPVGT